MALRYVPNSKFEVAQCSQEQWEELRAALALMGCRLWREAGYHMITWVGVKGAPEQAIIDVCAVYGVDVWVQCALRPPGHGHPSLAVPSWMAHGLPTNP